MPAALDRLRLPALARTGFALLEAGAPEQALALFQRCLPYRLEDARLHLWTGLALADLDQCDSARAELERAAALEPDKLAAQAFLARTFLDQDQPEQAEHILASLLAGAHPDKLVQQVHGLALLQTGQIQAGGQALGTGPLWPAALSGRILLACEHYLAAHPDLAQNLEANYQHDQTRRTHAGESLAALLRRARLRLRLGWGHKGRQVYDWILQADRLQNAGDLAASLPFYARAAAHLPRSMDLLSRQVDACLILKDYQQAICILEASPIQARAYARTLQASARYHLGQVDQAQMIFTSEYAGGSHPTVEYYLGLCALASGQPGPARRWFGKAVRGFILMFTLDVVRLRLEEACRVEARLESGASTATMAS